MRPSDLTAVCDRRELVGHFRLAINRFDLPAGWCESELAGWFLAHDPALPALPVVSSGRPIGWILGYPVGADGRLLTSEWSVEEPVFNERELERALYDLGGRFVAVFVSGGFHRIYADPAGSIGVMFSASEEVVASNPFLLPAKARSEERGELIHAVMGSGDLALFPFGLTPFRSIRWLMPNHYLDLSNWCATRHWPSGDFVLASDPAPLVVEIGEALKGAIKAVVDTGPVQMSLTAGQDSRMLMACSRTVLDSITFVTHEIPDRMGRIDVNVARDLARRFRVDHRVIKAGSASETDMACFHYRTGYMLAGDFRGQQLVGTLARMNPSLPYVAGTAGEVGRAIMWEPDDELSDPISDEELLRRWRLPANPEVLKLAAQWREELPVKNNATTLSLFFVEQRLGGWAGFLSYGYPDGSLYHFWPFSQRRIFEAMLKLPPEYRRMKQLSRDLIGATWPELLELPFNDASAGIYGAYRKLRRIARRYLKEPLKRAA